MLQLMSRATVRLVKINARIFRFFSVVRYLAYSTAKILTAFLLWNALGYVTYGWTGQGGFPIGHLVFLSWSVLLGLLAQQIYITRDTHLDTLALEDPVHGSIAVLFGVVMATTIWFGVSGAQALHTAISFLAKPNDFPNFLVRPTDYLPQIFFNLILYVLIPFVAGALSIRVGIDIGEDISYHKDIAVRRKRT